MGTQAISLGVNRTRNAQRAYCLTLEPRGSRFSHFALDHTRQVTTKTNSNAVNGGALLPVLVVRIPTSANMLNTCRALSNHVGLRSTTSSQPMVYAPMHALFALSLTITSLTRPRVITRRARCESHRSCACAFTGLAAGRGRGPLPAPFRLLPPRRPSTGQKAADIELAGPPHTRVTPTPTPACTVYPHARARLNPPSSPQHIVPSRTCAQPYPSPPLSQALTLTRHAGGI